ncbi:hypothetical protein FSP39_004373 [Pinctada imbricata]|uniref:Uncharacterized protein n=1 Tax=Pinctada imbricata TaxID=66713 RepID=A0AA89BZV4_PINIB|nr:hypothetical protein FSP39_004373 [Pinctada imbricata]
MSPSPLFLWFLSFHIAIVYAQECRFEFTVPETNGIKCPTDSAKLGYRVSHLETEMNIAHERSNSIAERLGKEITKIEVDTENIRNATFNMKEEVLELKTSMKGLSKVERDIERIKDEMNNTNDSIAPKFIELQKKMFDVAEEIRKQNSENSNKLSDLQQQIITQLQQVQRQTDVINEMRRATTSISDVEKRIQLLENLRNQTNADNEATETRLHDVEEILQPLPNKVRHFDTAMNSAAKSGVDFYTECEKRREDFDIRTCFYEKQNVKLIDTITALPFLPVRFNLHR